MSNIIAIAEAVNNGAVFSTSITVHQHQFIADEPATLGGEDVGPSPGDYLCASLASCKAITLRMYANRKGWKLDTVKVKVELVKGSEMPSGNNTFFCEVTANGELDNDQLNRLLEISKACPVQKLIMKPSDVITVIK